MGCCFRHAMQINAGAGPELTALELFFGGPVQANGTCCRRLARFGFGQHHFERAWFIDMRLELGPLLIRDAALHGEKLLPRRSATAFGNST